MRRTKGVSGVEKSPGSSGDAVIGREMRRGGGGSNPPSTTAATTAERRLLESPSAVTSSTAMAASFVGIHGRRWWRRLEGNPRATGDINACSFAFPTLEWTRGGCSVDLGISTEVVAVGS
ncbi:unnamed protein product [Lactuca virosa]|uniref:Uncharacterized protein n=1 Tax=Lactuca virosa TaxID=75947 RepID=A0AAU9PB65_9ASTR|nr:unnamed protein product [Lactuca virosa]